ncbi:MAG: tetratricopeptide repeat protein [Candidatus Krumholzibacteriota bacterium]|nr:tetratricopeptide repeat protein [Candidatus Krumholzibacteriota bacterium]
MKSIIKTLLPAALIILPLIGGCTESSQKKRYSAEKALFKARKMNNEMILTTGNSEFLDEVLNSYRRVISDYGASADSIEGMEMLMVSALMELAELEFRTGMFAAAREDFIQAYHRAGNIPEARANALWSAAFISQETGDIPRARSLYGKFMEEFLSRDKVLWTAGMNSRYPLVPLRLAEIESAAGRKEEKLRYLREAENIFLLIIDSALEEETRKANRYNLVTVYLQKKEWDRALNLIGELKDLYGGPSDMPSLLFLEAKIEQDGYGRPLRALEILSRISTDYPEADESLTARLTAGGIHMRRKEYDQAERIFRKIVDEFKSKPKESAEAEWQLAQIAEARGNWLEASLLYKSIYANYPGSLPALESPLRIANHFRDQGEKAAADASYDQAIAYYKKLSSNQYSASIQIMAAEYYVRAYVEQGKWPEAIALLLTLPDKFPEYSKFGENYLMAASIYEKEIKDLEQAAQTLRRCMEKYPNTDLARAAEKEYRRIQDLR